MEMLLNLSKSDKLGRELRKTHFTLGEGQSLVSCFRF